MNPYEIRLELLKMAQSLAETEYFETNKVEYQIWEKLHTESLSAHSDFIFTPFPSVEDIKNKAEELKKFVDNE